MFQADHGSYGAVGSREEFDSCSIEVQSSSGKVPSAGTEVYIACLWWPFLAVDPSSLPQVFIGGRAASKCSYLSTEVVQCMAPPGSGAMQAVTIFPPK